MPWSRRTPNYGRLQSWEVWVRDAHDGFVSEQSRVFANADAAENYKNNLAADFYKNKMQYRIEIRPSTTPVPLGKSEVSLRDSGRWHP